ncbi:RNA recognition motif RRM containing protein [Babesia gibsoni]|uniref:RNA recognition motif RRM containing protein n=1 Tax=Babesia gibsoni TaxID=33632 RepID=A0AAD8P8L5_BABGI|nr:RNA recognition motif RRM containing protein [Babesia gibsoni]
MRVGYNTRVIIKNLPLTLDEASVQRLVSQKCKDIGLVHTDCKLLTKKSAGVVKRGVKGNIQQEVSRGLCFVGFSEEKDATKFKDYYNGTYFRACKVTVEYSRPPPKIEEPEPKVEKRKRETVNAKLKKKVEDGEVVTTVVKKVNTYTKAGVSSERKHTVFDDVDETDQQETTPGRDEQGGETNENENEDIENLDRVILFNLPYNITEDAIRELCRPYGPVTEIHLPLNTGQGDGKDGDKLTKGYCYVKWMFPSDAVKFRDSKNRSIFCGRIIHVNLAKPKETHVDGLSYEELSRRIARNNAQKSSYKRTLEQKKMAQAEDANIWNTLHIDINATLTAVARQLEIGKRDIIDESSAAVNVALSETLVVNKLTKWLEEQGIDYKQFEVSRVSKDGEDQEKTNETKVVKRCDDTIIIKNLPSEASDVELLQLFSKYGQLLRLSISPYMVMGIVQFLEAKHAKSAFKNLAYKSYQGLPLYLEWAPMKLFHEGAPIPPLPNESTGATQKEESGEQLTEQEEVASEEDDYIPTNVSIYLKNLNFRTRDKTLENHFSGCKGYVSCNVVMRDNATLSRGFGFVEFDNLANAKAAIRSKTGLIIDGKVIEMSIAKKTDKRIVEVSENKILKATTKIIVKNLAFQATRQDLYKMFSFYGEVKSIRIPKSLKSNNRGFAFVDFVNRESSARAVESLQHTHLYGRHLILEFAAEDESTDER